MSARPVRVLVAMSGGVDSAVAAARLCDRGLHVVGVTLHLWDYPAGAPARGRCCAPEDVHDARRAADHLGIPHYVFDRRDLFDREVVAPFVEDYLAGRTPSPCAACNRAVKIRELVALCDVLGADRVATGHYARIEREGGRARLRRGRDRAKDQSYFLHGVAPGDLARLEMPLGESTKAEVRREAGRRGLPCAGKGESQELCFAPDGRYETLVEARAPGRVRPGPIVDADGREVGRHGGVHRFTIGQRRGIGVAVGRPAFVTRIDAAAATVRLGGPGDLLSSSARLRPARFDEDVTFPTAADVQVRYRHAPVRARLAREDDSVLVRFDDPVAAVTPGQVAVAYDGDRVIGGGPIAEACA